MVAASRPLSAAESAVQAAPAREAAPGGPVTKEMFLKLLVTQIRNQNPLNPADGTQFLTQLAQFTELEQTIAIRQELEAIAARLDSGAAPPEPAEAGK